MTSKQEELKTKYGTPREYEQNVLKDFHAYIITYPEARFAIDKYTAEWYYAGKDLNESH